jgi:hypothetical protein
MGNTPLTIPSLGNNFIDYRQRVLGDSFTWNWVRPLSQPQYLVIHHSAGPDNQTVDQIAAYHVNSRGWGGIGYHFVIDQAGKVWYVGDLSTARANVANMNHLVVGICLIGNFTAGRMPTAAQLRSAHLLCAHLLFETPAMSGVNGWEDIVPHNKFTSTACPGDSWNSYRGQIVSPVGTTPSNPSARQAEVAQLYQVVLGREPDQGGLSHYVSSNMSIEQIRKTMTESQEHAQLIASAREMKDLKLRVAEAKNLLTQGVQKLG